MLSSLSSSQRVVGCSSIILSSCACDPASLSLLSLSLSLSFYSLFLLSLSLSLETRERTGTLNLALAPRIMSSDSSDRNSKDGSLASLFKSMGSDDCDRPACDDTKSALSAALKRVGQSSGAGALDSGGAAGHANQTKSFKEKAEILPNSYRACPPTKDAIGVSTWSLVHSMVNFVLTCFHIAMHYFAYDYIISSEDLNILESLMLTV